MHALSAFLLNLVHHAGYGGLFIAMALVNIGAPGSEVILPAAGLAAHRGALPNLWIAIAVAVLGELLGQSIGYAVGRFGGRPFVERFGKYARFDEAEMKKVEGFFTRYGSFAVFICRFIPGVRGFVGIPAGIARMALPAFYFWTLCGSVLFCGGLIFAGNALDVHSQQVVAGAQKYALLIIALVVIAAVAFTVVRSKRAQRSPS